MAITRSQQAKQMLQDGGMTKKIKGQEHMLAYITPGEADKLVELGGQKTMTPEGIPAYPPGMGDPNYEGKTSSSRTNQPPSQAATNRESRRTSQYTAPKRSTFSSEIEDEIFTPGLGGGDDRDQVRKLREGIDEDGRPTQSEIAKRQKQKYINQFTSKGRVPPGPNQKARQRALNYINRNMITAYNRFTNPPTRFLSPTGYPNFGIPNIYQGINEALAAGKTLNEILEEGNMIPVGNMTDPNRKSYELNPIPDLDIDSIRELAATQSTLSRQGLTGYQADALEDLRENIKKRDTLIDTGDTSDIFPGPPEPMPDDRDDPIDPCLGPNPPAYCFPKEKDPEDPTPKRNLAGLTPRIGGSIFDFDQFAADGGRIGAMDGGIMNVENLDREAFLLGGIAKGLKKAVKGVKKLVKSPIGKAAILGAIGFGIPGVQSGFFSKGLMGTQKGLGFKKFLTDSIFGKVTDLGIYGPNRAARTGGLLDFLKSPMGLITGSSILAGLSTKPDEGDEELAKYLASQKLDPSQSIKGMGSEFDFYGGEKMRVADGGIIRAGYQEGGDAEPVAKKTMPLLDMDGKEKDYRETGGFVDMGRMERADDVPARLSKNEFVFTADAVRNAGEGNIDKGAEVMYNMMKNLESGGEVSEESQGLEGARKMFQTSQRLGEVI